MNDEFSEYALIEIKQIEDDDFTCDNQRKGEGHSTQIFRRDLKIESQKIGAVPGGSKEDGIHYHDQDEVFIKQSVLHYRTNHPTRSLPAIFQ